MNGLTLAAVSRQLGFNDRYLLSCIEKNQLSKTAVTRLYDKFQINPARYVQGWKGESKK